MKASTSSSWPVRGICLPTKRCSFDLLYSDSVDLAERARAVGMQVELHLLRDRPRNTR
ncbi:alpha/beta hydrolase [Bradyrhizobium sp. 149]|uniref:alpha/beta hydrolase n=1 Tax=Bradyrhizobium sp. 149 TaxID=2782624 RepID=UPI001FFAFCB5|nr:alpha/beta hydrolase [Bradyrhizobium sp. 149]